MPLLALDSCEPSLQRRRRARVDVLGEPGPPAPLREVDVWFDQFRRIWDQHLDALDTELRRGVRARHHGDPAPPSQEGTAADTEECA